MDAQLRQIERDILQYRKLQRAALAKRKAGEAEKYRAGMDQRLDDWAALKRAVAESSTM